MLSTSCRISDLNQFYPNFPKPSTLKVDRNSSVSRGLLIRPFALSLHNYHKIRFEGWGDGWGGNARNALRASREVHKFIPTSSGFTSIAFRALLLTFIIQWQGQCGGEREGGCDKTSCSHDTIKVVINMIWCLNNFLVDAVDVLASIAGDSDFEIREIWC